MGDAKEMTDLMDSHVAQVCREQLNLLRTTELIFSFSHLPRPEPAVLAVDHLLSPGALAARLQVVRVAQVPRLVVEVDVHLVKS